jgi:hypothetical protein
MVGTMEKVTRAGEPLSRAEEGARVHSGLLLAMVAVSLQHPRRAPQRLRPLTVPGLRPNLRQAPLLLRAGVGDHNTLQPIGPRMTTLDARRTLRFSS